MESPPTETVPAPSPASLALWERTVAVFARPTSAWTGLGERSQWWFPLIVMIAANMAFGALLWQRAILPDQLEAMEERVANGSMTSEQLESAETLMRSPAGTAMAVLPPLIITPIFSLLVAILLMFSVAFLLGGKLGFRPAFAVATWSSLIQIPGLLVAAILAWGKESMTTVHVSLAALLPEPEKTNTLMRVLVGVLDGLGPFSIWWVAVAIIGASSLSGVARNRVAWVLGGVYLAMLLFFSALGAMLGRGN